MDGLTAATEIRKLEVTDSLARTPIIALTANAMKSDEVRCLKAGMDDFLSKPVKMQEIQGMLSTWVDGLRDEAVTLAGDEQGNDTGQEQFPVLDEDAFKAYLGVFKNKSAKMIQKTIDYSTLYLIEIQSFIKEGLHQNIGDVSHKAKSSIGQLGGLYLAKLFANLEIAAARKDKMHKILEMADKATIANEELKKILTKFIEQESKIIQYLEEPVKKVERK